MQVFISSTYKDLIEERQAAVEAVLKADHIPAGMELFKAGDESQLTVIKKWIDQSDIYMLIVGGKYGSIEPKSQLSYTHLEFKMAIESGIPMFAIILSEEMTIQKILSSQTPSLKQKDLTETKPKLKKLHTDFVKEVAGNNRIVSFVKNIHDLKGEIFVTLADIIKNKQLDGWIRSSDSELVSTNIELNKQNILLKEEITYLKSRENTSNNLLSSEAKKLPVLTTDNIGGFSMSDITEYLKSANIEVDLPYDIKIQNKLMSKNYPALSFLLNPIVRRKLTKGIGGFSFEKDSLDEEIINKLIPHLSRYNLIDIDFKLEGKIPLRYYLSTHGLFFLKNMSN